MSYHIYTTEGIILKKRDVGEADRFFSVFTKDFGRIEVKARGVRYLKSKLRYCLSGDSILKITFVPTRNEYYRLVGAEELRLFKNTRSAEVLGLLERLIQGQQKDEKIWKDLTRVVTVPNKNKVFALRFLDYLGYAGVSVEDALEQSML